MQMSNIITKSTIETTGTAENAAIGQNMSPRVHLAFTADKEQLFSIIQNAEESVLRAALRNPELDQQHLLVLLKRRGLGNIPATIYANKHLLESYPVKFALACHPETPPHIVLTLLTLLNIFDLLKLCISSGIKSDIHLAAERNIIQRIPLQPLGNKLTLARRGPSAVVEALLKEGLPNLVEACLDNPHLKEGSLHQFISSAKATAETISIIARHSRWKSRPNIRLVILKNPHTPAVWFTLFLPGVSPATRRDLLASPRLTFAQKELVRQAGHHK